MERHTTLGEFIIKNQKDFPYAKGELSALLSAIRLAGKMVNQEINKAGLAEIRGKAGKEMCREKLRLNLMFWLMICL